MEILSDLNMTSMLESIMQPLKQEQLTIIGQGWAKYRHLSVASRSISCLVEALIIDLRDTDKSRYFALPRSIIVLSFDHRVCFLMDIFRKRCDLPFSPKSDRKKEKSLVSFTREQNIICRSRGWLTASERKEKFHRMITVNVFHKTAKLNLLLFFIKLTGDIRTST